MTGECSTQCLADVIHIIITATELEAQKSVQLLEKCGPLSVHMLKKQYFAATPRYEIHKPITAEN